MKCWRCQILIKYLVCLNTQIKTYTYSTSKSIAKISCWISLMSYCEDFSFCTIFSCICWLRPKWYPKWSYHLKKKHFDLFFLSPPPPKVLTSVSLYWLGFKIQLLVALGMLVLFKEIKLLWSLFAVDPLHCHVLSVTMQRSTTEHAIIFSSPITQWTEVPHPKI